MCVYSSMRGCLGPRCTCCLYLEVTSHDHRTTLWLTEIGYQVQIESNLIIAILHDLIKAQNMFGTLKNDSFPMRECLLHDELYTTQTCSGPCSETAHYARLCKDTLDYYRLWASCFLARLFPDRPGPLEASRALTHKPSIITPAFDLGTSTSQRLDLTRLWCPWLQKWTESSEEETHTNDSCLPWAWDKRWTRLGAGVEGFEVDARWLLKKIK